MREICTSGSVGGKGGNILAYPALTLRPASARFASYGALESAEARSAKAEARSAKQRCPPTMDGCLLLDRGGHGLALRAAALSPPYIAVTGPPAG